MYLNHYGLKEAPFGLTPDPKFIFKTESYLEALSTIKYGVEESKGLIVMVGEVGTGKTTTLRSALQQFSRDVQAAYIFNPSLTNAEFFEQLCHGFGLGLPRTASKPERLESLGRLLTNRHAKRMQTVLIIDEAHGLPEDLLEEVRLLVNFETSSDKLLQVVLSGQPELRVQLNRPDLRQLKQRISLRCTLKPLSPFEVNEYIRFRLKVAGATRINLFDAEAVALISRVSQGVPRVVNNICDNALLYGFSGNCPTVNVELVEEVIDTLDLDVTEPAFARESFSGAVQTTV